MSAEDLQDSVWLLARPMLQTPTTTTERSGVNDKKLYQQKRQAQLDKWQAEVDKLKANAAEASADAQLEMNRQVALLKEKVDEGKTKLAEIAAASEESWESIKDGAESAWESMRSAFSDALDKFRK